MSGREENVKNVYKIKNVDKIINKKILLVDDIYTTGATLNECSKLLKQAGTKKIDVFTIARGKDSWMNSSKRV